MTYREAFAIGSKCDGYIKCTYAQLANYEHGVLFSIQHANTQHNVARDTANEALGAADNTDATANLVIDVPVVQATQFEADYESKKFVPVKLTTEAIQILENVLKNSRKRSGKVTNKTNLPKLIESIQNGQTFYVKHVAIDWIPTNINAPMYRDQDGNLVSLDDALAAAKKKLDRAKAILATVTTITII